MIHQTNFTFRPPFCSNHFIYATNNLVSSYNLLDLNSKAFPHSAVAFSWANGMSLFTWKWNLFLRLWFESIKLAMLSNLKLENSNPWCMWAYMELGSLWSAFVSLAACVRIHYSNILWSFGQRSTVFVVTLCARLLTFIFRRICGFHSNGKNIYYEHFGIW